MSRQEEDRVDASAFIMSGDLCGGHSHLSRIGKKVGVFSLAASSVSCPGGEATWTLWRDLLAQPWSRYLVGVVTLHSRKLPSDSAPELPIPELTGKGGLSNFESVGKPSLTKLENGRPDGS